MGRYEGSLQVFEKKNPPERRVINSNNGACLVACRRAFGQYSANQPPVWRCH